MSITSSDLKEYGSTESNNTGGGIDTGTLIDTSGQISGTNLWEDITGAEADTGTVKYKKTFTKNTVGDGTVWERVEAWFSSMINIQSADRNWMGWGVDDNADTDGGQGGMTQLTSTAKVALVSDGSDSRNATVVGLDSNDDHQSETVTLTGTTEVTTSNDFSKVWVVYLSGTDASRTVNIRQGSGGTKRGEIGTGELSTWVWVQPGSQSNAITFGDVADGGNMGLWYKLDVPAGTSAGSYSFKTVRSGDTL